MANSHSVVTLTALIRARTDQTNSTTFDDATELKPWVKGSLLQLNEILIQQWRDYYIVKKPLSLIAQQEMYSLPPDFRAMQDVYVLFNQGRSRWRLKLFSPNRVMRPGNLISQSAPAAYRILRNQIWFSPIPQRDVFNAIELHYTPHFHPPLLDYSSIDDVLPNGWEEWVVLDVMEKMNNKLRLDPTQTQRAKQEMLARLMSGTHTRDGEPPVMMDVRNAGVGYFSGVPSGPLVWASA